VAKQPWPQYDEQTVVEIRGALAKADAATVSAVRAYESSNKKRQGVLKAAAAS
jgi:PIN domain nuclease of toxin-antitoxin system